MISNNLDLKSITANSQNEKIIKDYSDHLFLPMNRYVQ